MIRDTWPLLTLLVQCYVFYCNCVSSVLAISGTFTEVNIILLFTYKNY